MLDVKDRISTVPALKCQFCDTTLKELGIQDMKADRQVAKILEHYRQQHPSQFQAYCANPNAVRPEVLRLYNEGLKLKRRDKQAALDKFLECERLIYTDPLLLAVRLGVYKRVLEEIQQLAEQVG